MNSLASVFGNNDIVVVRIELLPSDHLNRPRRSARPDSARRAVDCPRASCDDVVDVISEVGAPRRNRVAVVVAKDDGIASSAGDLSARARSCADMANVVPERAKVVPFPVSSPYVHSSKATNFANNMTLVCMLVV